MAQARNQPSQRASLTAPSTSVAAISDEPLQQLIIRLIDAHESLIQRWITVIEAIEGHLAAPDPPPLQGETEELLRLIIQIAQKSIEALNALLAALQTAIIQSFFPAQP